MRRAHERILTLLLVPDSSGAEVQRVRVPWIWLRLGAVAAGALFVVLAAVAIHDAHLVHELHEVRALRAQNVALRGELERLEERVSTMATTVERVEQFDAQLRRITMLSDPARNLAIGPVGDTRGKPVDPLVAQAASVKRDLVGADGQRASTLMLERAELVERQARATEASIRGLQLYLEDQQSLLSQTPSLLPARGWKTSDFGFRVDPYTGMRQMHAGLDISTNIGSPVIAPGDGQVIWAGPQAAYGNVVMIDHGQGLVSFFAHLSEFGVKVGQQVQRGVEIAKTGNTGRSTGPHLHYEIRLHGIPQDPARFILEPMVELP